MSGNTSIEWTERTWNPLTGCTKVSPGCDNCYAKAMHERFNGAGSFDKVTLHYDRLDQPTRWRKPSKVFVNSMSDLFHKDVPDEFIAEVFAVMSLAPQHTFQLLTKRHGRLRSLLNSPEFEPMVRDYAHAMKYSGDRPNPRMDDRNYQTWPLPNVWLGVSVEDQKWADARIPALLGTPAAVRWISAEPLLGAVDLGRWLNVEGTLVCGCGQAPDGAPGAHGCSSACMELEPSALDWVVVGGESGPGARPMHPAWARSLRDQCEEAGVPYLFKQWGAWRELDQGPLLPREETTKRDLYVNPDGTSVPNVYPAVVDLDARIMRRVGKKAAGRELNGRTHDEYPAVTT